MQEALQEINEEEPIPQIGEEDYYDPDDPN